MSGEIALDTSAAIRFLNGNVAIVEKILALPDVILPMVVVGELLFGAENSSRSLQNLPRYLEFIAACQAVPLGRETAIIICPNTVSLEAQRTTHSHE